MRDLIEKVYVVRRQYDLNEGRGPLMVDSVWSNRPSAVKFMNAQSGVMGRRSDDWTKDKFPDWTVEEYRLMTSVEDRANELLEEARQKALRKLTAEERKILGLE